jgi:hypothetical protein
MVKYQLSFFLILFSVAISDAQSHFDNLNKEVEVGAFLSTSGQNPFWLRSNQYGIVPLESQGITVRARIGTEQSLLKPSNRFSKKDSLDRSLNWKGFTFNYAIEAVANVGKANQFIVPEAYAAVKWKAFELYAGRRREIIGLVDTTLSSGSFIWSGNALPLPKVQLSIPEYTSILGKGLISIKGAYAHGWFGEQYYLKNVFLHQKWLYGRLGKPNWKLKFYGGFNHQVQWGGDLNTDNITLLRTVRNNNIPKKLKDYINAVTGISLNTDAARQTINIDEYTSYDLTNRIGNHIGTIDIGFEFRTSKFDLMLYRQSIYDDGSLFYLANIIDGLSGISVKRSKKISADNKVSIKGFNFEIFNSRSQGGELGYTQTINYIRGRDNYLNHGQFLDGWGYNRIGIGTPFIPTSQTTLQTLPQYTDRFIANTEVSYFTNNNRVKSFYASIDGNLLLSRFRVALSKSINYGTYRYPFQQKRNQLSINLTFIRPWAFTKATQVIGSLAYDSYGIFKGGLGCYAGLKKTM